MSPHFVIQHQLIYQSVFKNSLKIHQTPVPDPPSYVQQISWKTEMRIPSKCSTNFKSSPFFHLFPSFICSPFFMKIQMVRRKNTDCKKLTTSVLAPTLLLNFYVSLTEVPFSSHNGPKNFLYILPQHFHYSQSNPLQSTLGFKLAFKTNTS